MCEKCGGDMVFRGDFETEGKFICEDCGNEHRYELVIEIERGLK